MSHFYYLCPVIPGLTGDLTRNRRAVPDSTMKILIDNGHGIQTKGKRSPDGTLLEYAYTRELARQIVATLKARGYDSELLVPEDDDIPLEERVRRINKICLTYEPSCPAHRHGRLRPAISPSSPAPTGDLLPNVILISIHVNAAGDGTKWMNATGWSCYTCKGQTESDRLADCLYKAAEQILKSQTIRTDYARDGDPDWEENFYILRHSLCPAVLVECFFMDNKNDQKYLLSNSGRESIIDIIVRGVLYFTNLWQKKSTGSILYLL